MSIKVMTRVWDKCEQKAEALLVMLALADWCDDSGQCFPAVPSIAGKARISERAAFNIINRLEAAGEIQIKAGRGRGNKSVYTLLGYAVKPERGTGFGKAVKPEPGAVKPEPGDIENLNPVTSHIEEPSLGTVKEPSVDSAPAAPGAPPAMRPAKKPRGADHPENRDGPFRNVFRVICQIRRLNPDILSEADAANTRRLTGTLCKAGVDNANIVREWGRAWYADIAKRVQIAQSEVTPPSIAQLTTAFGARLAPVNSNAPAGLNGASAYAFRTSTGAWSMKSVAALKAEGLAPDDADPFDRGTWTPAMLEAEAAIMAVAG